MDLILTFVVLPLATIIFSIALQRLLKCPILVAAVVFAVFLILTYTVFGTDFIIFAIVYAIIAFITALLTSLVCRIIRRLRELEDRNSDCDDDCCNCNSRQGRNNRRSNCDCDNSNDDLLTISSRCGENGNDTRLLTISTGGTCTNSNNNNSNNCNCGCNNNSERVLLDAEVFPNNNGRTGSFRGCFRRRF